MQSEKEFAADSSRENLCVCVGVVKRNLDTDESLLPSPKCLLIQNRQLCGCRRFHM
jgi:hypothetical protein